MHKSGNSSSKVLIALAALLALTLGWALFGEQAAVPVLEPEGETAQAVGGPSSEATLAELANAAQAKDLVVATETTGRVAVTNAERAHFLGLDGEVLGRDSGAPVEGAQVSWFGLRDVLLGTDVTTSDGGFQGSVPASTIRSLRVEKSGFEILTRTVDASSDFLQLQLVPACELVVHLDVLGDGAWDEVVYKLWLPASKSRQKGPVAKKTGDATLTEVRFQDLSAGTYELTAQVVDRGWAYRGKLTMRAGESLVVQLEIAPPAALSGRVTLETTQEAVASTRMVARPKRQGIGRRVLNEVASLAETDEDGAYRFEGLTSGDYLVLIKNGDLLHTESVELPNSGADEVLDIVVPPQASLTGEVRGPSGEAVAGIGVLVYLSKSDGDSERNFPGRWYVETEADGTFQFAALPTRVEFRVEACFDSDRGNSAATFFGKRLRLRKGEQRTGYLLELHPPRKLVGTVMGADSKPINGADLIAYAAAEGAHSTSWGVTNEQGEFSLDIYTPETALKVSAHGYLSRKVPVESVNGVLQGPLRIELTAISSVFGTVLDPEGSAVPFARVEIVRPKTPGESKRNLRGGRRARADEFGRFSVGGLAEGLWVATAANGGWVQGDGSSLEITLPNEEPINLVLTRDESAAQLPVTVRGAVRFKDGSIPEGMWFENLRGGALAIDGERFELTGVRPGRARFEISADGSLRHKLEALDMAPSGVYDLGTIELEHATDLRIVVKDKDGKFVKGARVLIRTTPKARREGAAGKRLVIRRDTKRNRYRLKRAPRGQFQLIVSHQGHQVARRIITVGNNSPQLVQIKLTDSK